MVHELDLLRCAVVEFDRRVDLVSGWQWDRPTPCPDWTVRDLVQHVIDGNRLAVALLQGAASQQALSRLEQVEPAAAAMVELRSSAEAMLAAFAADGAATQVCDHPADRITGRAFAVYRAGDIAVHAWDLARALRANETLDPELVEAALASYVPWVATLPEAGMFGAGPSEDLPADASRQQHLLDALGRRP